MDLSRDTCTFVPPWLLERLGKPVDDLGARVRDARAGVLRPIGDTRLTSVVGPGWTVHTASGGTRLPGAAVRAAGEPVSGDVAVDEAAAGISETLAMFASGLGRASYDGAGAAVSLTVHYGRDYDNAFWDGAHLVFGDGDGDVFERFTKPIDVLAHEFTHAVTEHTVGLVYRDQSGALNESVSDVFAACLKQRVLGQDAAAADWLIGEGLFRPTVQARGLRDMARPGTAFDDPRLGRDPQVGHMDDYVVTTGDNGGVHLNSGIPNRAFHLAALAIGGSSLEGAGRIWFSALTAGDLSPRSDFVAFAAATVAQAGPHADAVRTAWEQVGVAVPGTFDALPPPTPTVDFDGDLVEVIRTGGFAGLTVSSQVPLAECDDDLRALIERVDLASARSGRPLPDLYSYTISLPGRPAVTVPEQHLTDDLRVLTRRVLEMGRAEGGGGGR